ncbi:MAG: glycosyl transferase [Clostridia bacterium]|nr:MAG: glycosyl transferase [Clostridia bacterium]
MGSIPPAYMASIILYFSFLALFLRYFLWKYYADCRYWRCKPKLTIADLEQTSSERRTSPPFISILIPARNEAEVIANTIDHMATLNYPANRYEIIVVTDAKELAAISRGELPPPSTQEIVVAKQREYKGRGGPAIRQVAVPYDFDGRLHGDQTGHEVPSTKARALNYGLQFVDERTVLCGFYDAESHPDPDVLLHVAYSWLVSGGRVRLWQGPVFQVRNFYQLGPITKVAALYQAIAHEWYLPNLMRRLPFIGGTNFFAEHRLLKDIGGFDPQAFTEDLEIGVRAFLESSAWPEYLPCCSTEQTPATISAFFRQRLRWASGHLQVVEKFRRTLQYPEKRRRLMVVRLFIKGQGEWTLYQSAVFVPFLLAPIAANQPAGLNSVPLWLIIMLRASTIVYLGFTFYLFFRYNPYMDRQQGCLGMGDKVLALAQLFFLPVASFFFPLPYSTAMVLRLLHREPQAWIKTPRTRESTFAPQPMYSRRR